MRFFFLNDEFSGLNHSLRLFCQSHHIPPDRFIRLNDILKVIHSIKTEKTISNLFISKGIYFFNFEDYYQNTSPESIVPKTTNQTFYIIQSDAGVHFFIGTISHNQGIPAVKKELSTIKNATLVDAGRMTLVLRDEREKQIEIETIYFDGITEGEIKTDYKHDRMTILSLFNALQSSPRFQVTNDTGYKINTIKKSSLLNFIDQYNITHNIQLNEYDEFSVSELLEKLKLDALNPDL